jgi:hypothetical protein
MRRTIPAGLIAAAVAIAVAASVRAQVRGNQEWTTTGYDAQRTAWLKTDARLTKAAVRKGAFQLLWKAKFGNDARQLDSLTEPILLDQLIGYRGFKTLAFVGGSADRLFAIDTDLAKPYWTANLNYAAATGGQPPSSWDCPGGLTATPSRRTILAPSTFGGPGGGGRGGSMTSAVGEPGKGAAILTRQRPATPVSAPTPPVTPPRTGGDVAPAAASATTAPSVLAPIPFGGVDPLYAVGADGLLRTLRVSDGAEMSPMVPFVPPGAKPSALIFVDGLVYTSTSNGCGTAPNAVWAIDLTSPDKKVATWNTGGASVAGHAGLAFGTDGTLYVAVGNGPATGTKSSPSTDGQGAAVSYANAVVALDRRTLKPRDWFTAEGAGFTTSPTVIRYKDKDLIAAAASDGKLYLLDSASLGGSDHKTPLFVTPKYAPASATGAATDSAGTSGALATWDDGTTRWILAPVTGAIESGAGFTASAGATHGSIVAFKLVDGGGQGKITLEPGWQSRDLASPLAPVVVNGLVIATASGEYRGPEISLPAAARAQRSTPAVLYVLDGTTGQELWASGSTITSFARAGVSAGGGQVYLVTYDNELYAFGIPMEH